MLNSINKSNILIDTVQYGCYRTLDEDTFLQTIFFFFFLNTYSYENNKYACVTNLKPEPMDGH